MLLKHNMKDRIHIALQIWISGTTIAFLAGSLLIRSYEWISVLHQPLAVNSLELRGAVVTSAPFNFSRPRWDVGHHRRTPFGRRQLLCAKCCCLWGAPAGQLDDNPVFSRNRHHHGRRPDGLLVV